MKKFFLAVTVMAILALVFPATHCWAEDDVTAARISVAKKTAGFVAGLASGFLLHEAGHEIVGLVEGVHMSWSGGFDPRWTAYTNDHEKLRRVAIAGFGAEIVSAEIILGVDAIPKDNAFVLGVLTYAILNPVIYLLRDNLQHGGYGDYETLRNNGANVDLIKVGMLAHAALSAYRLYKNPKFIPYVQVTKNEIAMGLTWRW